MSVQFIISLILFENLQFNANFKRERERTKNKVTKKMKSEMIYNINST